jgi:glycosyltransferase involved in cell wall biosynthesis
MKKLTIFTPTYNRAYILPQVYQSLLRQTNTDFLWLIIDDGSLDNTAKLVKQWQTANKIEIKYIYQENQGMHGAHNTAYENINTELNVCIDSDDFMTDDAVDKILIFWKINQSKDVAGFIALDADKNGKLIGTKIPEGIKKTTLSALYHKHNVKGDKKLVLRTEVVKILVSQSPNAIIHRDGLDIALISIDLKTRKLQYSGAYIPLIIIRNGELIEYKAVKASIVYSRNPKPFEQVEISLMDGDIIYLFSDGYIDQYGGLKNSKFYRKNFYKLLLEISSMPLDEQLKIIDQTFNQWKGTNYQIDDVTVMGLRIDFSKLS